MAPALLNKLRAPGDFWGELSSMVALQVAVAFGVTVYSAISPPPHGDNNIAHRDTDLYMLTLEHFNQLADKHKRLAFVLITALSRTLAHRLRHANGERTLLQT